MAAQSPWGWMIFGVLASVAGGVLLSVSAQSDLPVAAGIAVLACGGLILQVCVIAAGVTWGMQRYDDLRAQRRRPATR